MAVGSESVQHIENPVSWHVGLHVLIKPETSFLISGYCMLTEYSKVNPTEVLPNQNLRIICLTMWFLCFALVCTYYNKP